MSNHNATHFSDPEMGRLMTQVEQLVEGKVVALIIQRANGKLVVSVPGHNPKPILEALSAIEWAEIISYAANVDPAP